MQLGRVTGTLVSSRKEPLMEGMTFLVVRQINADNTDTEADNTGAEDDNAHPNFLARAVVDTTERSAKPSNHDCSDTYSLGLWTGD